MRSLDRDGSAGLSHTPTSLGLLLQAWVVELPGDDGWMVVGRPPTTTAAVTANATVRGIVQPCRGSLVHVSTPSFSVIEEAQETHD